MLFNLQGAHRFQRRAFILPQRTFLVKHFFQAFSNLFVLSSADPSPGFAVLADSLIILPRSFSFVKHFFQVFANFFVPFPGKPSWPLPSQTAYRGYHCRNHLSSTFFRFFNFFCAASSFDLLSPRKQILLGSKKKEQSG